VLTEVVGRSADEVQAALRKQGVLVRYFNNIYLKNYIRISSGRPSDIDAIITALKELK